MKQHFEQSVLSKLPERYNSHSKQSVISEEDDMGNFLISEVWTDYMYQCGGVGVYLHAHIGV